MYAFLKKNISKSDFRCIQAHFPMNYHVVKE